MSRTPKTRLARSFWCPERMQLLQEFYGQVPAQAIADALEIQLPQVYGKAKAMGLMKQSNGKQRPWVRIEEQLLREWYSDIPTEDIALLLDRPKGGIYRKAYALTLEKSPEFQASVHSGRVQRGHQDQRMVGNRFKKGIVPWNKGKHTYAGGRSVATQFQKGRPAHEARNYVPIGTHRLSKDGYLERKVTDDPSIFPARRWVGVHRILWEEANGPIPEKHLVCFKPGQFTNVLEKLTLDRLELLSMAENARRNHWSNNSTLKALVPLKTAITRQVNRISRETKERSAHEHR